MGRLEETSQAFSSSPAIYFKPADISEVMMKQRAGSAGSPPAIENGMCSSDEFQLPDEENAEEAIEDGIEKALGLVSCNFWVSTKIVRVVSADFTISILALWYSVVTILGEINAGIYEKYCMETFEDAKLANRTNCLINDIPPMTRLTENRVKHRNMQIAAARECYHLCDKNHYLCISPEEVLESQCTHGTCAGNTGITCNDFLENKPGAAMFIQLGYRQMDKYYMIALVYPFLFAFLLALSPTVRPFFTGSQSKTLNAWYLKEEYWHGGKYFCWATYYKTFVFILTVMAASYGVYENEDKMDIVTTLAYPLFNIIITLVSLTIPPRQQKAREVPDEIRNFELNKLNIPLLDSFCTPTLTLLAKAEARLLEELRLRGNLPEKPIELKGDGEWKNCCES